MLEEVLAGVEGVEFIRSISRQEQSMIAINFGLNRDPDAATSDVRDRAGRVAGRLPDEADEPVATPGKDCNRSLANRSAKSLISNMLW